MARHGIANSRGGTVRTLCSEIQVSRSVSLAGGVGGVACEGEGVGVGVGVVNRGAYKAPTDGGQITKKRNRSGTRGFYPRRSTAFFVPVFTFLSRLFVFVPPLLLLSVSVAGSAW